MWKRGTLNDITLTLQWRGRRRLSFRVRNFIPTLLLPAVGPWASQLTHLNSISSIKSVQGCGGRVTKSYLPQVLLGLNEILWTKALLSSAWSSLAPVSHVHMPAPKTSNLRSLCPTFCFPDEKTEAQRGHMLAVWSWANCSISLVPVCSSIK